MAGVGFEERNFEETESYIVAGVFLLFLLLTWVYQRILRAAEHYVKDNSAMKEVFEKVIEEFLILGLITFTLLVFEQQIVRICINSPQEDWFLCSNYDGDDFNEDDSDENGHRRRLLAGGNDDECFEEGKEPLVSATTLHEIHLVVFLIGIFHVLYSASVFLISFQVIKRWKVWEEEFNPAGTSSSDVRETDKNTNVKSLEVQTHKGLHASHQQFYRRVSKENYNILRLAFIQSHDLPATFNFNKYLEDALIEDYPKLIGLSWWLWIAVIVEALLRGFFDYVFEVAVGLGLVLSIVVGAKLRSIILTCMRNYNQSKAVITDNKLFWFGRPDLVFNLLRLIAFFDSTEIAFTVLSLWEIGVDACKIEDHFPSIIVRMCVILITFLHISLNVVPMAVIGIQLGSHYKPIILGETAAKAIKELKKKIISNRGQTNGKEEARNDKAVASES